MKPRMSLSLILLSLLFATLSFGQKHEHFYNVDKEIKVKGTILEIILEPRYKNTAPFLIVILKEKKTLENYKVEISPIGFFDYDFHKGEHLKITGSLYQAEEKGKNIIAREVQFGGKTLILRDRHGFPKWRRGQINKRWRRKGRGN